MHIQVLCNRGNCVAGLHCLPDRFSLKLCSKLSSNISHFSLSSRFQRLRKCSLFQGNTTHGFLATIFVIWGLVWSMAIGLGEGASGKFGVLLLAWAPASLLLWFVMHRASQRDASHAQMLQEAGMTPGMGFDHAEKGTGIALNKQSKTLSLLINGFSNAFPYADVREWVSQEKRAGQVWPWDSKEAWRRLAPTLERPRMQKRTQASS